MSSIAWLDASSEEQKRMREILGLFTDKESREELGLGQIRDALSDGLFPGTSTLHTRARYMLFIPWIYQQVSARRGSLEAARKLELTLVKTLSDQGSRNQGIIGYEAGSALKTMPSTVYWSALGAYGILSNPRFTREMALSVDQVERASELEELGDLHLRAWHHGIPTAPDAFPVQVPGGMNLTYPEAEWLRERILYSHPDSILAHLTTNPPLSDRSQPWADPAVQSAGGEPARILHHARRFSEVMHGAQLLYNVLIAESYEHEGFTRFENRSEYFTSRIAEWAESYEENTPAADWDVNEFFMTVTRIRGSRVSRTSENFIREWISMLRHVNPNQVVDSNEARKLVATRERRNKGAMARIGRRKRLQTWGGSSGERQYAYRWFYVRRILGDIHTALGTGASEQESGEHQAVSETPEALTYA